MDTSESELNVSKKENNKRKSSISVTEEATNNTEESEDSNIKIFIDTTGTHQEVELETSIVQTNSNKKKNKKNKSLNKSTAIENAVEIDCTDGATETPVEISFTSEKKKKKKKNKSFDKTETSFTETQNDNSENTIIQETPVNVSIKSDKKKNKNKDVSQIIELVDTNNAKNTSISVEPGTEIAEVPTETSMNSEKKKKKKNKKKNKDNLDNSQINVDNAGEESDDAPVEMSYKSEKKSDAADELPQETKKRKNRDDDGDEKIHKVSKKNSFDKIHVPKIPESVVKQLSENPRIILSGKLQNNVPKMKKKKSNIVIATVPFVVEQAERRKNKPSNYLEQSIYLNDSPVKTKQNRFKDKPKVLPFTPTALTSDSGYTSKFNINVLPGQTQFVAQASNVDNFRESYLGNQRIKKMGTLERFKLHRSHKISKF